LVGIVILFVKRIKKHENRYAYLFILLRLIFVF